MTDPAHRPATPDDRPSSTEEAAAIVREDPALRTASNAGDDAADDAATDDDARTPDSSPTGESRG
jgi:hypothetical protein